MLRELGRRMHRIWLIFDVSICVVLFSAIVYHPQFAESNNLQAYSPVAIGLMALFTGFGWQIILGRCRVYESHRRINVSQLLRRLTMGNSIGAATLAAALFTVGIEAPPFMPVALAVGIFTVQAITRISAMILLRSIRRSGRNFRNVLIVGAGPRARNATNTILNHPEWGLRVIGYLDALYGADFRPSVPIDKIHKIVELPELLRNETVDELLVACPRTMLVTLTPVVNECALIGVPVTVLADLFGDQLPAPKVGILGSHTTLSFAPVHHNELELMVKRVVDILGALVGLLLSAPVVAVAAVLIRLDSKGPIFFCQERCGLNGRRFEMIKLRTMNDGADAHKHELMHLNEMDGPVFKLANDPRITPIGHFLRRTSIDEFPQFLNVLVGDMSLVGPRPPTPEEVICYEGNTRRRLSMRPGLTCYWQVGGRNNISFAEWIQLDLMYIDTWSLLNDLVILLKTVPTVIFTRGAS